MNEKTIWDYLSEKVGNPYGVAAIMGNLMAESSLNPRCATGKNKTPDYVMDADSGKVDFVHDGVAFGLVQWCYHSRKEGLINLACKKGSSVGNLDTQLEYLWKEMIGYKTVWNKVINASNLKDPTIAVMTGYEKPADTGEAAKQKRIGYAKKFYEQFTGEPEPTPSGKKMVRATAKVNLRAGAGLSNLKVGSLPKGKSLEWIESKDGWHKVAVWVSGDYSEVRE